MLVAGALSVLTRTPQNVIIRKYENVYMECSSDTGIVRGGRNMIQWYQEGHKATDPGCNSTDPTRYKVSHPEPVYDCFLTALRRFSNVNHGNFKCSDGYYVGYAVAVLIGT